MIKHTNYILSSTVMKALVALSLDKIGGDGFSEVEADTDADTGSVSEAAVFSDLRITWTPVESTRSVCREPEELGLTQESYYINYIYIPSTWRTWVSWGVSLVFCEATCSNKDDSFESGLINMVSKCSTGSFLNSRSCVKWCTRPCLSSTQISISKVPHLQIKIFWIVLIISQKFDYWYFTQFVQSQKEVHWLHTQVLGMMDAE